MAIAYDSATGNTGTGTTSPANLVHSANVMVIITVAYVGSTSPSGVTVGAHAATYLTSSKGTSGNHTNEVWYCYLSGAATDATSPTFAVATRHAWCAAAYTGVAPSSSFEGLATASGSAVTPTTASVTVAAGTSGRIVLGCNGCGNVGTGAHSVAAAPGNGETERQEQTLAGIGGVYSVNSQTEEFAGAAAHTLEVDLTTTAGKSIEWCLAGFALLPAGAPADTSKMLLLLQRP